MELARQGFDIIMLCRYRDYNFQVQTLQMEIQAVSRTRNVYLIPCDLGSVRSIYEAAENIRRRFDRIDVLINNAGRIVDPLQYSPEGIELTFMTNYLSHFLLTYLLLDLLKASDEARVINVASELHRFGRLQNLLHRDPQTYSALGAYCDSKLAKLLFTYELADRLMDYGITVNAMHPWLIDTNFAEDGDAKGLLHQTFRLGKALAPGPETAAKTTVYLASSPEVRHVTGLYFANCRPWPSSPKAQNRELSRRLWTFSETVLGIRYPQTVEQPSPELITY